MILRFLSIASAWEPPNIRLWSEWLEKDGYPPNCWDCPTENLNEKLNKNRIIINVKIRNDPKYLKFKILQVFKLSKENTLIQTWSCLCTVLIALVSLENCAGHFRLWYHRMICTWYPTVSKIFFNFIYFYALQYDEWMNRLYVYLYINQPTLFMTLLIIIALWLLEASKQSLSSDN